MDIRTLGAVRAMLRRFAALGRRGERVAARWLRRRGYRILERNLVVGRDEADLVALAPDRRTIVIVEVKTRRGRGPMPEARVDRGKRRHLTRMAERLHERGPYANRPMRLDVLAIRWPEGGRPEVRHFVGV